MQVYILLPTLNSTAFYLIHLGKAMSKGWGFINTKCAPWPRVNDKFGEYVAAGEKSKVSWRRCPGPRRGTFRAAGTFQPGWLHCARGLQNACTRYVLEWIGAKAPRGCVFDVAILRTYMYFQGLSRTKIYKTHIPHIYTGPSLKRTREHRPVEILVAWSQERWLFSIVHGPERARVRAYLAPSQIFTRGLTDFSTFFFHFLYGDICYDTFDWIMRVTILFSLLGIASKHKKKLKYVVFLSVSNFFLEVCNFKLIKID